MRRVRGCLGARWTQSGRGGRWRCWPRCEAGIEGRSSVVEDGVVIREVGEAESNETLQHTIGD
jgi:hypothetical protein